MTWKLRPEGSPGTALAKRQESVLGGGNSLGKGSEAALQKSPVQSTWDLKGEQDGARAEAGGCILGLGL